MQDNVVQACDISILEKPHAVHLSIRGDVSTPTPSFPTTGQEVGLPSQRDKLPVKGPHTSLRWSEDFK